MTLGTRNRKSTLPYAHRIRRKNTPSHLLYMHHAQKAQSACNSSRRRLIFGAGLLLTLGGAILVTMVFMAMSASPSPAPLLTKESWSDTVKRNHDSTNENFPYVDWDYWLSLNPDIVGWVTVPDTCINYPIVQAPANDPDYYLTHDIYRHYNIYGVPYLDAACAENGLLGSFQSLVYAHHMSDGSQFAAFASYSDKAYASQHQTILIQTPNESQLTYRARYIQIIPGTQTKRTAFVSRDDYLMWYETQLTHASVTLDATTRPDSVVTFVTCSYHYSQNERTLVTASLDTSASSHS